MEKFLRFLFFGLILAILWYLFVYLPSHGRSKVDILKDKYRKYKNSQQRFINHLKHKIEIDKKANLTFKKVIYSGVTLYMLLYFLIFQEALSIETFLLYVSLTGVIYTLIGLFKTGKILSPNDAIEFLRSKIYNIYYRRESFNYYLIPVYENKRNDSRNEVLSILKDLRKLKSNTI
jgi:hypothetical protein